MATHSSILAGEIPWIGSLEGYSPWGGKESDMTDYVPPRGNKFIHLRKLKGCRHPIDEFSQKEIELHYGAIG